MKLQTERLTDLERGVALHDSIGTRAARPPALMTDAAFVRPYDRPFADRLTETAIGDFEWIAAIRGRRRR